MLDEGGKVMFVDGNYLIVVIKELENYDKLE